MHSNRTLKLGYFTGLITPLWLALGVALAARCTPVTATSIKP